MAPNHIFVFRRDAQTVVGRVFFGPQETEVFINGRLEPPIDDFCRLAFSNWCLSIQVSGPNHLPTHMHYGENQANFPPVKPL